MQIIDRIKNLFKRGGYALSGQTLKTINDHPKINIDPKELARIDLNLKQYEGDYPQVEYINSHGHLKKRDYMTLNMRKLSAEVLAGLVFNEQCEIYVSDVKDEEKKENSYKSAHDFIEHVFEHNKFKKNLADYLEPTFALGGLNVRPYVDSKSGEIEFSWALANAFFPLRSNSNGISEGVIKSVTTKVERNKTIYYTLLEFHEWEDDLYVITNELYKSDNKGEVGKRVPLDELYENLQERTEIKNLSRPLFNYVKPSGFNNICPLSPLGLGIADNATSTLKKINDTYDQFWWEVKMGQRTVFVSDSMLNTLPDEAGNPPKQVFDPDVNVYKSAHMGDGKEPVKDVTSDIRTEQYISAINQSLRTLEMELKLSVGTFSFDGRSMKTATEIVSENDLTYRTRNDHVYEVEQFIKGLVVSVLELAKAYGLFSGEIPTFEHIGVDFDDGVFQDRSALLKFYGQAKTYGFIPTVEVIQRVFKVPKDTAEQWLQEIQAEQLGMDPSQLDNKASNNLFGDEE
ncbi:phage portal protein [Virgibacillus chiguensis]|uniref:Phage portal protein, putative, A118 family n=1 Tax=Virgibacillus chiguensis TaxID=411959 RepID=A0A1M5XQY6_9BACI|nr:phage portal protein [Virgibacillus chiguensis]SHI01948.1 phage portal protein, putative, A118 family [Virgibacillus chiguensis]